MKSESIKEGLFFMDDFKKLPKETIIYIKSGKVMVPEGDENE